MLRLTIDCVSYNDIMVAKHLTRHSSLIAFLGFRLIELLGQIRFECASASMRWFWDMRWFKTSRFDDVKIMSYKLCESFSPH